MLPDQVFAAHNGWTTTTAPTAIRQDLLACHGFFNKSRTRTSRNHKPPHSRQANTKAKTTLNQLASTRTWLAIAPPRYPVSKIAPRIEVRGNKYRSVHASRTIPIPAMSDSG